MAAQLGTTRLNVTCWESGRRTPRREATQILVDLAQMNGLDLFNMPEHLLPPGPPPQVERKLELVV